MTDKKNLRQFLKNRYSQCFSRVKANECLVNLLTSRLWQNAGIIACYYPLANEIDCRPLFMAAWQSDKTLLLPKITDKINKDMAFFIFKPGDTPVQGPFGLSEPPANTALDKVDLYIVPGLGFDKKGQRLGYGAGYYDRYFAKNAGGKRLGLCLEYQIVDVLPHTDWDIPMQALCTEKYLYILEQK